MSADKELWKTGKTVEDSEKEETGDDDTLDLSSPSPDTGSDGEEIDLDKIEDSEQTDEEDWLPPLLGENEEISIRTVGLVGMVTILLLTGALVFLLNEQKIVINVPYEKYEDRAIYDIEGAINFESTVDVPLPI